MTDCDGRLNSPDTMHIIMDTPGGSVTYDVPASRMARYTLDDIFEKKLYMLIPFYIFNCEQDFEGYDTDQEKLEQLKDLYRGIIERLEELVNQNKITAFDKGTILELSSDVVKELAHKYSNMTEGIGEIMSGTMIETQTRKTWEQGGDDRDKKRIAEMLSRGKTPQEIADFCGYPLELVLAVQKSMKEAVAV